jgi:hypothetical protein
MKEEIIKFIEKNNLSPFEKYENLLSTSDSVYKTRDAKSIHQKVISKIASNFSFSSTKIIFNFFSFTEEFVEINKRQQFFSL